MLLVVQNLPVERNRRDWQQAQALVQAGFSVAMICPAAPGDPARSVGDGVVIHTFRPAPAIAGKLGYVIEVLWAWVAASWAARSQAVNDFQKCYGYRRL